MHQECAHRCQQQPCKQGPACGSERRQQQAFGENLPDQPVPPSANRDSQLYDPVAHTFATVATTLFGRDLWPDVPRHAANVEATVRRHALTFYRRHGYRVVGVLPDVNGPGRPDIFMAKRLGD